MMHVARVAYKEEDAEAWQARLLIHRLPPVPFLVFFRGPGPGEGPEVLPLGKGAAAELGKEVEKKGLFWQTLPALRPATLASLGCALGGGDAGAGLTTADLCVVAVTPQRGAHQVQSRTNTLRLLMMLYDKQTVGRLRRGAGGGTGLAAASLAAVEAAARAVEAGKLRITWVDAPTQQAFCRWGAGRGAWGGCLCRGARHTFRSGRTLFRRVWRP